MIGGSASLRGPGVGANIGARAGDHEILEQHGRRDAEPLLHVGGL